MADYDNTNRGVLFRNERKETDNQPDYTGSINVEGEERWLDAWVRESKDGKKFFSISTRSKNAAPQAKQQPRQQPQQPKQSGDVPF